MITNDGTNNDNSNNGTCIEVSSWQYCQRLISGVLSMANNAISFSGMIFKC